MAAGDDEKSTPPAPSSGPSDPKNFVFLIFYLLGVGTLLPWNFFISVSEYWKYKWRTVQDEQGEESREGCKG